MNTSEYGIYTYTDSEYDDNTSVPSQESFHGRMVLSSFLYVLFSLGLLGNVIVLWMLLRHMKLKTMTDVCLLNLALSDLILALSLPLWAYNFPSLESCKVMTGVYQLGLYSGTLFVTLMSMDRYLAIVHAVAAMKSRSLCYGIIASIIIWVFSIIMAIPQVIFASVEIDVETNSSFKCQPKYPYDSIRFWKIFRNVSENFINLFVCLPIMMFCYLSILIVVSRTRNSKKGRAMKLIFTIVCVFVVCWVPYNLTVFFQTLQMFDILNTREHFDNVSAAMSVCEIIALAHCCVNPVIYAFVGEKFRKSVRKVLMKYLCWSDQRRWASGLRDTTDKETSNTPVRSDY
ncbi:C-C chemokine receptor type 1 [Sphaeramia orbicularis]|uniref:C-C chemokine receptor type 1-like n=1 Tax=Sphaeramia orbicularis TaxID=375764 RepID=A0A673CWA8_9TELE|nr:C-C chemokine receptor type 1-like [Sphaeramia orbicularis]XP_030014235.1 C-C chemokine receptor type 1-like [Sphaeramia orbicularis]